MASIVKCAVRSCKFAKPVKGRKHLSTCIFTVWAGWSKRPTINAKCESYMAGIWRRDRTGDHVIRRGLIASKSLHSNWL